MLAGVVSLFEVGIDSVGNWIDLASLHQSLNGLGDLGGRELLEYLLLFDVLYDPVLLKTQFSTL